jgi:hypothetical protein
VRSTKGGINDFLMGTKTKQLVLCNLRINQINQLEQFAIHPSNSFIHFHFTDIPEYLAAAAVDPIPMNFPPQGLICAGITPESISPSLRSLFSAKQSSNSITIISPSIHPFMPAGDFLLLSNSSPFPNLSFPIPQSNKVRIINFDHFHSVNQNAIIFNIKKEKNAPKSESNLVGHFESMPLAHSSFLLHSFPLFGPFEWIGRCTFLN